MPSYLLNATSINFNSIARACETDAFTIEQIVSEMVAQIKFQIKNGGNLKLYLKIGRLSAKNSNVLWNSLLNSGEEIMFKSQEGIRPEDDTVFSKLRKDLSVLTPSVTKTDIRSRHRSYVGSHISTNSYHMANPNPQSERHSFRFKGVKDLGYTRYAREVDPTDIVKFGKRMYHGEKMSNVDMMEHHIK